MRTITTFTPPSSLRLQTLRGAWQRLSMVLLVLMLTTTTAWATVVADYKKSQEG